MKKLKIAIVSLVLALSFTISAPVIFPSVEASAPATNVSTDYATVTGKVSDTNGIGISKAGVLTSDAQGNNYSVVTNSFGYYEIRIPSGVTYTFTVSVRDYEFDPLVMPVYSDVQNVNFTAK